MPSNVEWNSAAFEAEYRAKFVRKVHACTLIVQSKAKVLLSKAGTGQGRGAKGKFIRVYGAKPSAPGDPPAKQTGRLRGSVAVEVDGLIGRVGTNVLYGRYLELGTRKMKARPWLRRSLRESVPQIQKILRSK